MGKHERRAYLEAIPGSLPQGETSWQDEDTYARGDSANAIGLSSSPRFDPAGAAAPRHS